MQICWWKYRSIICKICLFCCCNLNLNSGLKLKDNNESAMWNKLLCKDALGTIDILRNSTWTRWVQKMAIFADVQYCIHADIVGGSKKVKKCGDVIYGWSLMSQWIFALMILKCFARYVFRADILFRCFLNHKYRKHSSEQVRAVRNCNAEWGIQICKNSVWDLLMFLSSPSTKI